MDLDPFKLRFMIAKHGVFRSMPRVSPDQTNEVSLWRAVIDQTLHDLGSKDEKLRAEAEIWFDLLNEDFLAVCELAEIPPEAVITFVHTNYDYLKPQDGDA